MPPAIQIAQVTKRLHENRGLAEEFARWAAISWALALGLLTDDAAHTLEEQMAGNARSTLSDPPASSDTIPAPLGTPSAPLYSPPPSPTLGTPPSIILPMPPLGTSVTVTISQPRAARSTSPLETSNPTSLEVTIVTSRTPGPNNLEDPLAASAQPTGGPTIFVPRSGSHDESDFSSSDTSERKGAFISYSHKDSKFLEQLKVQLAYYARRGVVDYWDATKIQTGANWQKEVERAIEVTRIAVLLVSAEFLASDFIAKNELPPLLAEAQKGGAIILPVILSACVYEDTELARFQAFNSPSKPLLGMSKHQQQVLWTKIARHIMLEGKHSM